MKEGIFVLGTTIQNPRPDRRTRDQWLRAIEWPAGGRFSIRRRERHEVHRKLKDEGIKAFVLEFLGERHASSVMILESSDGSLQFVTVEEGIGGGLQALVDNLVPSTDPDDVLRWCFIRHDDGLGRGGGDVLLRLFRKGLVTVEQINACLDEIDAEVET